MLFLMGKIELMRKIMNLFFEMAYFCGILMNLFIFLSGVRTVICIEKALKMKKCLYSLKEFLACPRKFPFLLIAEAKFKIDFCKRGNKSYFFYTIQNWREK